MELQLTPSPHDIEAIRNVVHQHRDDFLVRDRQRRCLEGSRANRQGREDRWMAMVACLLTTQQRSGPTSAVNRFLMTTPSPISLPALREAPDPATSVARSLKRHGGIRLYNVIGQRLAQNLAYLDGGGWGPLEHALERLPTVDPAVECGVARHVEDTLSGFGPKQSRNLLQVLGLGRWEVPLDSRVVNWCRTNLTMPFPLNATLLADSEYYEFAARVFRELCDAAGFIPALVDAAIFASYDDGGWNEETLVWLNVSAEGLQSIVT